MQAGWLRALILLAVLVTGCNRSPYSQGGIPDPDPVRSIVSLSPGTTELLFQLQLGVLTVGRTSNCDYPPGVEKTRIVVSGTKPDFEKIVSMKPDLIVYDTKLYANTDMEKLKSIPGVELMPMDVNTVNDYIEYILQIGARCGSATFASDLADEIYASVENAKGSIQGEGPRVAIVTGGGGSYYVAGTESFLADVIKCSGGQPVGPQGKIFGPMSLEALVKADPEIILTSDKGSAIINDPRMASVSAVRSKPRPRVYEVDPAILLRTSPRVKSLIESLTNAIQMAMKAKVG